MATWEVSSKKDRFAARKQARKQKQRTQEAAMTPEAPPPQSFKTGGAVRGMGAAKRGGKYTC